MERTADERERLYPKAQYLDQILGKTITGVVVRENASDSLRSQVFLVFSDGTHFEFYSQSEIVPIKGVRCGGMDEVTSYSQDEIVYEGLFRSDDGGE